MTRTQLVASAIGATLLALGPAATADVTTPTTPLNDGQGCHAEWHDTETGAPLGWADTPSQACDEFVPVDDSTFTGIQIDTGDGIATTGQAEAAACLAEGSCVEVLPDLLVGLDDVQAVREFLRAHADDRFAPALDWPVWDQLADCESGGNWAEPGRLAGGLQFTRSSWRAAGGLEFAPSADLASRVEQIVTARALLDMQGWRAWPACSREIGAR